MKDNKIKERFILLRGEGLSFDKIAKMINVSKPTLIEWEKEFNNEIKEIKEIRFSEILEKYNMLKEKRIERIAKELELAWKAYEKMDYKEMNKRELSMVIIRFEKRLKDELEPGEKSIIEGNDRDKSYDIVIHRKIIGEEGEAV